MSTEEIRKMTLEDLAKMPAATVGTAIVARFLEVDRWNVTLMARQRSLPFPTNQYYFSGNRLHVRKDSILAYFGYAPQEVKYGTAD